MTPVEYRAQSGYRLDIEVLPAAEIRRRVLEVPDRGAERVDLLCLIYVTGGIYTHMVDFEVHQCTAGSALSVHPGQVHRFGTEPWDGWFVVVRPEHTRTTEYLADEPDYRATHVHVPPAAQPPVRATLAQMARDAVAAAPARVLNTLLLHQFRGLLVRLALAEAVDHRTPDVDPDRFERFCAFRAYVDRDYTTSHSMEHYARQASCSIRSLTRAVEAVSGTTAKAYLTHRIVLQAKRELVHGNASVARIATDLGFDEPTNFVKYFRRETGMTPGAFRALWRGPDGDRVATRTGSPQP